MQGDLVYDIGMHTGEDTRHYLDKGFRVVAVEANPALVRQASERFADELAAGRLVIIDKAIGGDGETIPFHVHRLEPQWSSIHSDRWSPENTQFDTIEVACVNLADLMRRYGVPRYAKIDIEGADHIAVGQLASLTEKPLFLSIEGGPRQHVELLASLGYDRFMLIDQHLVCDGTLPPGPGVEGKAAPPNFGQGHSGPFGLELPFAWLTADQVIAQFEAAWANRHNHPIYFDIHATRAA